MACGSYVELNPVRARMAKDPREYRWSSYRANAYGKKDDLLDARLIYDKLFHDQEARREYRKFVRQMMETKEAMRGEMERRKIYGSGAFIREVNKRFKIEAMIKERGRPKLSRDGEGRENENK